MECEEGISSQWKEPNGNGTDRDSTSVEASMVRTTALPNEDEEIQPTGDKKRGMADTMPCGLLEGDADETRRKACAETEGDTEATTGCPEDEIIDPLAYLKRPGEQSTENFKIEIKNLPKHYGPGQLKKFLQKLQISVGKIKFMKTFAFACLSNEEERDRAISTLKGIKFHGNILDAKVANPVEDPLLKKRKAIAESGSDDKRSRIAEPIAVQIMKKTAPYADKPYAEQLQLKKKELSNVLRKLGSEIRKTNEKIKPFVRRKEQENDGLICPFNEIVPSPKIEQYRNKCEFTIGINSENGLLTVGFRVSLYREGTCAVAPVDGLAFVPDAMKKCVRSFETYFRSSGRPAYNPVDHSGFWRQILMRTNLNGEIMAVVQVHPQNLTSEEMDTVKNDLKAFAAKEQIASLHFQAMGVKTSSDDPPVEYLCGATHLIEHCCGLKFKISPQSFFQVNTLGSEVLYRKIGELAQVDKETHLLDVCCGTGTIGLSLAKQCKRIYGIEMIPDAIEDAKENATLNSIANCEFLCGKAEDRLEDLLRMVQTAQLCSPGECRNIVAVVDPPRAGLQKRSTQLLRGESAIKRLVYVACNANLAMKSFVDLCRAQSNQFAGTPFVPVSAVAVDLFPDTPHCELIILFERYRPDM